MKEVYHCIAERVMPELWVQEQGRHRRKKEQHCEKTKIREFLLQGKLKTAHGWRAQEKRHRNDI